MGQIGSSEINAVLACRQPFLFVPVVVGELSPSLCVANALVANCSIHWKSNIGQRISACAYVSMVASTLLTGHRGPDALLGGRRIMFTVANLDRAWSLCMRRWFHCSIISILSISICVLHTVGTMILVWKLPTTRPLP